jgi:acyl carrier protein
MMLEQPKRVEQQDILAYLTKILTEITAEWDVGEISPETRLDSLGLESISLVYLIGEVQQHYNLQNVLFEKLRAAAIMITDLRVADVVDMVCEILAVPTVTAGGQK